MSTVGSPSAAGLVGGSRPMQSLRREIDRIAGLPSTVLIRGETGVGKGLVARALHGASRAGRGRFVHVDCASLAPQLVESELFGHERGSFTGASALRVGRFERAAGGTIFLDEIAELEPRLQSKLLRVLQDREFERLGGDRVLPMTARVVAATARDLGAAVRDGSFRADLYFRLDVMGLAVPPLRERVEDLPELLAAGFARFGRGLGPPRLTEDAFARLARHPWWGNVRELFNVAERLLARHSGEVVTSRELAAVLSGALAPIGTAVLCDRRSGPEESLARISSELRAAGGNVSRTARRLGLPRSTLRHWIRRYDLG